MLSDLFTNPSEIRLFTGSSNLIEVSGSPGRSWLQRWRIGSNMAIKLKRLGGTEEEPYCIEIQGYWPDATMILIHLERLKELEILSKASAAMTDDVQIHFTYKGYPFIITSPFSYLWISVNSPDVPEAIFEVIVKHIQDYKPVWPHHLFAGILRHRKIKRWRR